MDGLLPTLVIAVGVVLFIFVLIFMHANYRRS